LLESLDGYDFQHAALVPILCTAYQGRTFPNHEVRLAHKALRKGEVMQISRFINALNHLLVNGLPVIVALGFTIVLMVLIGRVLGQ
jgi:hypothetical protein